MAGRSNGAGVDVVKVAGAAGLYGFSSASGPGLFGGESVELGIWTALIDTGFLVDERHDPGRLWSGDRGAADFLRNGFARGAGRSDTRAGGRDADEGRAIPKAVAGEEGEVGDVALSIGRDAGYAGLPTRFGVAAGATRGIRNRGAIAGAVGCACTCTTATANRVDEEREVDTVALIDRGVSLNDEVAGRFGIGDARVAQVLCEGFEVGGAERTGAAVVPWDLRDVSGRACSISCGVG